MSTLPPYGEYATGQEAWLPPAPPPRRRSARGRIIISLVVLAVVGAGALAVITNKQYISDQWTVWHYDASSVVTGYENRATMTDHGRFLFQASQPVISAAAKFNAVCGNTEEGSGVLGCYTSNDKQITLFDVTDPRLDGLEEVVASHEMLHAAWDRMSLDEQNRLGTLLDAEAKKLSGDAEFTARMAVYDRTEPGERTNELHSIIGTEIADLSPKLETYYRQYFSDRKALVALHVASNAVFVELTAKSDALVAELDALNASMEADGATYNSGYDQLNADISAFNARADSGGYATQEEFDRDRAALISRQAELDALYAKIQAQEATFAAKKAELAELDAQAADLNTAINIQPRTTSP
jgi:hypothetical protein